MTYADTSHAPVALKQVIDALEGTNGVLGAVSDASLGDGTVPARLKVAQQHIDVVAAGLRFYGEIDGALAAGTISKADAAAIVEHGRRLEAGVVSAREAYQQADTRATRRALERALDKLAAWYARRARS